MSNYRYVKLTFFLIFFINNFSLLAQNIASPISPEGLQLKKAAGVFLGLGPNWQDGSFRTSCDCPEFTDGTLLGFSFGAFYEQDIFIRFMFGLELMYETKSLNSSYRIYDSTEAISQITGDSRIVNILWRHKAAAGFSQIGAIPYLKWEPIDVMYFKLGFSFSFFISASIQHSKELLQTSDTLSNGEPVTISLKNANGNTVVVEDSTFREMNTPQIGLIPMIGFNIPLARNVFLNPEFQMTIPLNNASNFGSNFKIYSWRFVIGLSIGLKLRKEFH